MIYNIYIYSSFTYGNRSDRILRHDGVIPTVTCLSGTLIISTNVNDLTRAVDCVTCGWREHEYSYRFACHKHTLRTRSRPITSRQTPYTSVVSFNYFPNYRTP